MLRLRPLLTAIGAVAILAGCTASAKNPAPWTYAPEVAGPGGPVSSAAPGSSTASGETLGSIKITAADLSFSPNMITVAEAGTYTVELTNTGAIQHNVTFDDGITIVADPGKTEVESARPGLAHLSVFEVGRAEVDRHHASQRTCRCSGARNSHPLKTGGRSGSWRIVGSRSNSRCTAIRICTREKW